MAALEMEGGDQLRVAVVGSGPAGMFCADRLCELAQSGQANLAPVHLFRSRSKMSATQMETDHNTVYPKRGAAYFDYGCQYITAGSDWFRGRMVELEKLGIAKRSPVGVVSREAGYEPILSDMPTETGGMGVGDPGWVGPEGMWVFQERTMEKVARERGERLILHHSVRHWPPSPGQKFPDQSPLAVKDFQKNSDGTWTLRDGNGACFGPFDILIGAFNLSLSNR